MRVCVAKGWQGNTALSVVLEAGYRGADGKRLAVSLRSVRLRIIIYQLWEGEYLSGCTVQFISSCRVTVRQGTAD